MNSELATLTILPVNKTVVFYSPIEGKDILVRTGTIAEGSCFFHTLMHAYSKEYVSMNTRGRMKFIKRLRSSIARKVDKKHWEGLSNGLIAKIPFQENINNLLTDFYRFIKRGKTGRTKSVRKVIRKIIINEKKDLNTYKLITEMLPLAEAFEKNILPSAYEKCNESKVSNCKHTIVTYAVNYYKRLFQDFRGKLEEEKIKFYLQKLEDLVHEIVDEAECSAYTEYIESLHDSSMEVDSYTIGLVSDKFNRDIYFIDARTRMPYRIPGNGNIKMRKSIVVMWTGGCHYEVVGKLLPGNRIQREFERRDPLIQRIYTYLYKPEMVPSMYPNLAPYLPRDLREKLGLGLSDSEFVLRSSRRSSRGSSRGSSRRSSSRNSENEEIENSSEYEISDSEGNLGSNSNESPVRPSVRESRTRVPGL